MTNSHKSTVSDLREHALIARIAKRLDPAPASVIVGIGDDAAVVESDRGMLSAVTTDSLVDGIHIDRTFTPPRDIGHKALAVSLSDLAAMGATPRYALLSLALPPTLLILDLDAILDGLVSLADRHQITLIGGNVTQSPEPLFIEVTALGSVKRRRILTRSNAKHGDELYLSGHIGGAAAGLGWLQQSQDLSEPDAFAICRQRYLRPEPRVRLGTLLGHNRVTHTCIDLSDGLADAVSQLASASGVGIEIDAERLPIEPEARTWFKQHDLDPIDSGLAAGEDYELLFTVSPTARRRLTAVQRLLKNLPLTRIGRVTEHKEIVVQRNGKHAPLPAGYEHFQK